MKHVTCVLMGGLGNQLFQIFTTIAYGIRNRRKFVFPYNTHLTIGTIRNTYWHNFLNSLLFTTTYNKKIGFQNEDLFQFTFYKESDFHYHEIPDAPYENIILHGYFQSYKYFQDELQQILRFTQFSSLQEKIKKEFQLLFMETNHYISLHFRLGDYVYIQDHHPLLSIEYYLNALKHVLSKRKDKNIRILYFCQPQDNDVVNAMIRELSVQLQLDYTIFIKMGDDVEDWKQLLLMSSCQDNIIANSTFSWWGAYLNTHSDKIVCYPEKWFGEKLEMNDTKDLFLPEWHKVILEKGIKN